MARELLPDVQQRFRAAVLSADDAPMAELVRAPERLDIYRHTVQSSLIDVLATAFPVVRRVVGVAYFAELARRFVIAAPPQAPQLSAYGAGFADFIAASDIAERLPYLSDVARLEWARGEAYFAADAPPLDLSRIGALSPLEMEREVLKLHPAARLIRSPFPIFRIWKVNQPAITDVPAVDMAVAQDVLISRLEHQVAVRMISATDAVFLEMIAAGMALRDATDVAQAREATFDMQAALTEHFVNGTFRN